MGLTLSRFDLQASLHHIYENYGMVIITDTTQKEYEPAGVVK
jgi:hypothetical protein